MVSLSPFGNVSVFVAFATVIDAVYTIHTCQNPSWKTAKFDHSEIDYMANWKWSHRLGVIQQLSQNPF